MAECKFHRTRSYIQIDLFSSTVSSSYANYFAIKFHTEIAHITRHLARHSELKNSFFPREHRTGILEQREIISLQKL